MRAIPFLPCLSRLPALALLLALCPFGSLTAQRLDSLEALQRARVDIETLCSDSLAGRGYQRDGNRKAAYYIARRLQEMGLKPVASGMAVGAGLRGHFPLEAYFQPLPLKTNLFQDASFSLFRHPMAVGEDFIPASYSGSGSVYGEWERVGSGTPEELAGRNLPGKIAILQEKLPEGYRPDTTQPEIARQIKYEFFRAMLAHQAGAAAAVILKEKLTSTFSEDTLDFPVLEVLNASYQTWQNYQPRCRVCPNRTNEAVVSVQGSIRQVETQNVCAMVPGADPNAPAIVLCAHYDHLGQIGDAIFRGANDNASGVAFLLMLAEQYAKASKRGLPPFANPLIFLFFTGEEVGLIGSTYYVEREPLFPLEKTRMVLNFDLLGYGEDGVMCVGCQTFTRPRDSLLAVSERLGNPIRLAQRPNKANSDHWPFTQKGVPGFFFYLQGGKTYYHDVHDRPAELSLVGFWPLRKLILAYIQNLTTFRDP